MTWANEYEIDNMFDRFKDHEVLGPAVRTLSNYRNVINRNSDGWPYWSGGTKPASKLTELLEAAVAHRRQSWDPDYVEPTLKDVVATYRPMKALLTKRLPDVDQAAVFVAELPKVLPRFRFEVTQTFECVYVVEAESLEAAREELLAGGGTCVEQIPGPIGDPVSA